MGPTVPNTCSLVSVTNPHTHTEVARQNVLHQLLAVGGQPLFNVPAVVGVPEMTGVARLTVPFTKPGSERPGGIAPSTVND